MAVNLSALAGAGAQFFDNNGVPLTGGKLYSYEAGTTTPQATYTSASGATAHTNPIILNSAGRVATGEIWLTAGQNYKFVLATSADVTLVTWDNITGINGTGIASNAINVAFDPAGTGAVATTVQAKLREFVTRSDYNSQANYVTARNNKFGVDGDNRTWQSYAVVGFKSFGYSGDTFSNSSALRDGYTVSRDLTGLTDCHAFSDKTVMDQVTDSGTYGAFDATTILRGSHTQDHVYSFQDRTDYQGSGTLQNQAGLYSFPVLSGTGTLSNRYAVRIGDTSITGTGTITQQIGVLIEDLDAANNNSALTISQTTDYAIYASGGAPSYHKGKLSVGNVDNLSSGVAFSAVNAATGPVAFLNTTASLAQIGAFGADTALQFINNAGTRLEITGSPDNYTVRPGADNVQPLGDVSKRWSQLYAGTAVINTSDATEKQQIAKLTDAEKAVATRIKSLVCTYKLNEAVDRKGQAARIHVGVVAQDVKAAFEAEGLDAHKYAILCHDEWLQESEEVECLASDEGAYAKSVEIQKTEIVTVEKTRIDVVGEKAIKVFYSENVTKPVYKKLPVFDDRGNQLKEMVAASQTAVVDNDGKIIHPATDATYKEVFHKVPMMETVTKYYKNKVTKQAGGLYGIRYEELMAFVIAAM